MTLPPSFQLQKSPVDILEQAALQVKPHTSFSYIHSNL